MGIIALLAATSTLQALEVAYPFGDHMVLQRGTEIPVWGTATGGAQVSVKFGGAQVKSKAGSDGKWKVTLPAMSANEHGQTLEVSEAAASVVFKDILVGDVWYASGQSNMTFKLKQCATGQEAIAASADSGLRFFNHTGTLYPNRTKYSADFLKGMNENNYYASPGWQVSSSSTAGEMSGVAYFFGKKLRDELKVPVGIVHVSVGGSPIEAHISTSQFAADKEMSRLLKDWWQNENYPRWCRDRAAYNLAAWFAEPALRKKTPPHPFTPTFLSKAGPERFQPLPIKGVIWYQGESNAGKDGTPEAATDGALNKKKFKMLVKGWRDGWKNADLPVYHVQLPGLNREWAVFREMQFEVSRELDHVGMAVSIDRGHPTDVHPHRKLAVGERLARLALADTYGKKIVPNGPLFVRQKVDGARVFLDFENSEGMRASEGESILGFEVAGSDEKFHTAKVKVSGKYLEVSSPEVARPVAVRYAWDNEPRCNLVNGEGLPASPFRSDKWKKITPSGNVYKSKIVPIGMKKSKVIRVACIGDSITFGYGIRGRENSYPAQLQKLLGDKYEVRNFGNSGRGILKKSLRGSEKRAFIYMKEHKLALAYEPHIVLCNLGINDLMDFDQYGSELKDDYKELLEQYKILDTYPRVIVWKDLAPLFKGQAYYGSKNVARINQEIAQAAKELDIETIDMRKPLSGKGELFPDKLHPNAAGAKIIAETTAALLKKK